LVMLFKMFGEAGVRLRNGLTFDQLIHNCQDQVTTIVSTYIDHLLQKGHTNLIAFYTSILPDPGAQVRVYASKYMALLKDTSARQTALHLAKLARLPIRNITTKAAQDEILKEGLDSSVLETSDYIMTKDLEISEDEAQHEKDSFPLQQDKNKIYELSISKADKDKIYALEWLCFDEEQRLDALWHSNALARAFLTTDKLDPVYMIYHLLEQWLGPDYLFTFPVDESAEREHECIKLYLDAHRLFNIWTNVHKLQPQEPLRPLPVNRSGYSQILYSDELPYKKALQKYNTDLDKWKIKENKVREELIDTLDKIYKYPNGWLSESIDEVMDTDAGNQQRDVALPRIEQLQELRKIYIPRLFFMNHEVLHQTKHYQECLKLADTVADEYYQLYLCFSQKELQKLLLLIRESAIELEDSSDQ